VAGGAALALCGVAGCARPVEVPEPTPGADVAVLCARFTAALPDSLPTVGDRREVTGSLELTAAYGDPPVGVRCGVPEPEALSPTSTLVTIDSVDWFPEELTGGWRMTTVGLPAEIEISVPGAQGPAPSVAADLVPVITGTIPSAP
jgi:hypothetical protein